MKEDPAADESNLTGNQLEPVDLMAIRQLEPELPDPEEVAESAGLVYVSDTQPGIRRVRTGRGFRYLDAHGNPVTDPRRQKRLKALVIPPAWTDVWISPRPNGHIQATGRDARGRKQYIYHPEWRRVRDETKYHRMLAFGAILPEIRARVDRDMSLRGMPRDRILATLVRLLDATAIRIGNWEYARDNESFGLSTLRTEHVTVEGSTIRLHFRGKGGKELSFSVRDRRVTAMVRRLQELPGQELFHFRADDGSLHPVDSSDVNQYLHEVTGQPFTAKDFRTWTASVITAEVLVHLGTATSATQTKRNLNAAIGEAAKRLGNTRTVCRSSYVHPEIIDAYTEGWLEPIWRAGFEDDPPGGIHPEETAMLAVLVHSENLREQRTLQAG